MQRFRYLSGTFDLEISLTANSKDKLVSYTDSDYVELIINGKSTSGFIFMLSGKLLSYQSKLESTGALLSCQVKYIATTEAEKKALWDAQFLTYFGFCLPSQLVDLCANNKEAILLTKNPEFY